MDPVRMISGNFPCHKYLTFFFLAQFFVHFFLPNRQKALNFRRKCCFTRIFNDLILHKYAGSRQKALSVEQIKSHALSKKLCKF